jgi:hypothetical protein
MKLNEFFKKLNEKFDLDSIPEELKVEFYGDDDGAGKGPQMGTGDPWENFKKAAKSQSKEGYAVEAGEEWQVFNFYLVPKANAKKFESWLKAGNRQWEKIENYDPSEYTDEEEKD